MGNRPTGKNTENSDYFPPPVCEGEGKPACADGSVARYRFNTCSDDEKKCPTGQGFGAGDKPRPACADGSKCSCPGGGKNCAFRFKRCANRKSCVTQCKKGVPHCHGGPRTGINMTGSGTSTQGREGLETDLKDITGDQH